MIKKIIFIVIGLLIVVLSLLFYSDNSIKDSLVSNGYTPLKFQIERNDSNKLMMLNSDNLMTICSNIRSTKKLYFFSYYCAPCMASMKKKSYGLTDLNGKDTTLPTILISCDAYGTGEKLEKVLNSFKVGNVFILDENMFKNQKLLTHFSRLESFLKNGFPTIKPMLAVPYSIILDSNNNILTHYPGSIEK